ncbi:MAG: N-acetylglucosamine-6-phosphate deacetylase [Propionibacteriaceae bacterium]
MRVQRLRAARVFDGDDFLLDAEVVISGEQIIEVGPRSKSAGEAIELGDVTLAPGLVDVHCHGGGGANFADDPITAVQAHRRWGTTSLVASLVTGSLPDLERQVRALVPHVNTGVLAGIHLEGPWLSPQYNGAHPLHRLCDPDLEQVQRLIAAGQGTIRMVTLAVEREGAIEAVRWLASQGVVSALGHSAATYDQAAAAIAAGVTGATHLFNAMAPLHHREPGPTLALLENPAVWCELIFDGIHVKAELLAQVLKLKQRSVLITDAMAAAGCADGHYQLGEIPVTVSNGIARIQGSDTIAGSTLVLAQAVQNAIAAGVDPRLVLRAATTNPAAYLGLTEVGSLDPGHIANLVTFDADYSIDKVMYLGQWQ